jgi:hypothetical protein
VISWLTYFPLIFPLLLPGFHEKHKGYRHPLYIAVAQIDYNNSDEFATLLCKTFSDDLERALEKRYPLKQNVETAESRMPAAETADYIKTHLQVTINGKEAKFIFVNFTKEDNTASIRFRIDNIMDIKKVEVTDTIFYELYDKQIHIVYVTVNGNRKSNRMTNPQSKVAFDF